jgi:hypothetical protein
MSTHRAEDEPHISWVVERASAVGRRRALADAARALAAGVGLKLDGVGLRLLDEDAHPIDVAAARRAGTAGGQPPAAGDPTAAALLLGRCFEALLTDDARVAGAHYTPTAAAEAVADLAIGPSGSSDGERVSASATVCDPSVGGGVFLVVAADRLLGDDGDRSAVLRRLWGFDIDPLAVAVTETALALWTGAASHVPTDQLVVADFLAGAPSSAMPMGGWTVVMGNPPFQSQLAERTARGRDRAAQLRDTYGSVVGGYVDEAGLFIRAATDRLESGGRAALILPASLLAAADAAALRTSVSASAPVRQLLRPDRQVFAAGVDVVVAAFERGAPAGEDVLVARGAPEGPLGPAADLAWQQVPSPGAEWAELLADAEGVPRVRFPPTPLVQAAGVDHAPIGAAGRMLGDIADVTAGFRQHFYGLRGAVAEAATEVRGLGDTGPNADADPHRPLVTVGLVDPLTCRWGSAPTKFAGTTFQRPVVDVDRIEDPAVAAWVAARRRPKILVATQTRVIEAVGDPDGRTVPSTPVISVEPHHPEIDLWPILALLCAPGVTAWLHRRAAGSGLSAGRIRPTASSLRAIPLPAGRTAWDDGARAVEAASGASDPAEGRAGLLEAARAMTEAYGHDPSVTEWWTGLLPGS